MEKKREITSSLQDHADAQRFTKKAYTKPALVEYGSVAKLTRALAGSMSDGVLVGMMVCL